MARVQPVKEANKKNQTKVQKSNTQPKGKVEPAKAPVKKVASKNEIMFFRLGMSIIALALITVAIIFTIEHFMNKDEEPGVFDDYISITASDLSYLTGYDDNSGVYGGFTYFAGQESYAELFSLINSNTEIYIFFYSSSALNDDVVNAIKDADLEGKAFFIIDLDKEAANLGGAAFAHLNLDLNRTNLLVTFDVELQEFSIELRAVDIIRELSKI
jgi:hypothetical protein